MSNKSAIEELLLFGGCGLFVLECLRQGIEGTPAYICTVTGDKIDMLHAVLILPDGEALDIEGTEDLETKIDSSLYRHADQHYEDVVVFHLTVDALISSLIAEDWEEGFYLVKQDRLEATVERIKRRLK